MQIKTIFILVAMLIVGVSIMAMADRFETRHAKKLSVTLRKEQHRRSTGIAAGNKRCPCQEADPNRCVFRFTTERQRLRSACNIPALNYNSL